MFMNLDAKMLFLTVFPLTDFNSGSVVSPSASVTMIQIPTIFFNVNHLE